MIPVINEKNTNTKLWREEDLTLEGARSLDKQFPSMRDQFYIPKTNQGNDEIYFCGNSLGCQPKNMHAYMVEELKKWETLGVRAHFCDNFPWMPYHEFVNQSLANLVGAKPHEVVAMNSLTVNLHLLMVSFYQPKPGKQKILIEAGAFPSDHFAVQSQINVHGYDPRKDMLCIQSKPGHKTIDLDDWYEMFEQHGDEIALLVLPGVQYLTGQYFDIAAITKLAHEYDCYVGVDAAHAAGNVPLAFHDWGVDFATWCHYKYCNSGPGAIAGAFVHEKHAKNIHLKRLWGWWGHDKTTRFLMKNQFEAMPTAEGWQLSNPNIMALAMLRASLDIFEQAGGIQTLRKRSIQLTSYLEKHLSPFINDSIHILTPQSPQARGAQLSIQVCDRKMDGLEVFDQLSASGVSVDWRQPDIIRVAPVPLYNTFEDIYHFSQILKGCFNHGK